MNHKKLSIIIPVYKAEKFIAKSLRQIDKSIGEYFSNYEIIAVIDGRMDRSYEEASKVKGVKIVGYSQNKGKGFALKYGFQFCTGDYVTFIDADMDLHPKQLKNFIPYMTTADMIIGSKRHPFSKVEYPFFRRILSKMFQMYSCLVLGVNLRDTQSGLKLMKNEMLQVIMPLAVVKRYAFDLELCFLALKHGFKVVEAPINLNYQFKGSGIGMGSIWGMFLDVLGIRYRYTVIKYYQRRYHEENFR